MDERESHQGAVGGAAVTFDPVGVPIITLTGEIDVSNVDSLRATIEPAVETAPERIVFDLTALEFMDSSGVALLLHAATRAGSVHLRQPSNIVRRIIEITGLTDVLHIDG
jgi:anti-anti-sigma factor